MLSANKPIKTIGIIGGGQLGMYLTLAAQAQGYDVVVLDPDEDCPCSTVANKYIKAHYTDETAIENLFTNADVVTFEFENIPEHVLKPYLFTTKCPQGNTILGISQDRLLEKKRLSQIAKVTPFADIQNAKSLHDTVKKYGYPVILKTRQGGYDGKGQWVINSEKDLYDALPIIESIKCIAEQKIDFSKEASIIITRNSKGESVTFPITENIHRQGILHKSIMPADLSVELERRIRQIAHAVANELNLIGNLGIEMFITKDDEVYINEIAPRPHNSAHHTLESCRTSQFSQHINAICGKPLTDIDVQSAAIMINILGQHLTSVNHLFATENVDAQLHLYHKKDSRENRKMGHITILAESREAVINKATSIMNKLRCYDE